MGNMSLNGVIEQVSLSPGGVPKLAVPEAEAGPLGLAGDVQRNRKYHGGVRQALLLIAAEDLDALRAEGFPVTPGALGENLTVRGVDFRQLRPGMRFRAGAAVLELTKPRTPCATLDVYNPPGQRIQTRLKQTASMGGFYAAVTVPGRIGAGDRLEFLDVAV
jgi:MOSC domain-containing protein YiiM